MPKTNDVEGIITDLRERFHGPDGEEWKEAAERFLRKEYPWLPKIRYDQTLTILVDYAKPVSKVVKDEEYNWVSDDFTRDKFPVETCCDKRCGSHTEQVEAYLVHFTEPVDSDKVEKELDKQSLRPATIQELLAFHAKYFDLSEYSSIKALGSKREGPDGDLIIPCVFGDGGDRYASITDWHRSPCGRRGGRRGLLWRPKYDKFLAVRQ